MMLAPPYAAAQHGPRPLPLFLDLVASQTESDPERRARILAGLRAYQDAPRAAPMPEMPIVAGAGRAVLRDYGGEGPPAVFVPSLINPPIILDLTKQNSLVRWMAGQGVRPLLVDWGSPDPSVDMEDLDVAGHVAELLLPLLDQLGEPVHLIGYCLGGTMALAAAMQARLLSLTLIAAPWHFAGFGEQARAEIGALWRAAHPSAERLGLVPMEVLQTGFWRLDPARTVSKYEAFARMAPDSEPARSFVALEDWANGGAPLTYAAGRELFDHFIGADVTGQGRWRVGEAIVDPAALQVPTLEFVSLHDRIVPAPSSARLPDQRLLGLGHVGMIVGSRAREQLWEPLAAHLSRAQRN
ncbi:alpha/beta hydrolase [Sphingomonas sp. ID1715]|uniref:alpha/beta fold hydrolase n=1 Tax=Sphingomonas sp. ID1715 TaxID=1656898 RepID=UPI001824E455|nr:alpha/beta fold hydrolase [Sphingomonas sp. ID1715]NNM76539.1 alpha/beta hydrolase [Sphingomonas sp. ID1715]